MQIVIGIVGEKGAGKQTLVDYLIDSSKAKICHMRFSDLLKDTLTLWNLPHSRSNFQQTAIIFNKTFGDGTLSRAIRKRVENEPSQIVVLDGVRWLSDEELIRSFPNSLMIYITASAEVRFARLKKRNEKIGEAEMNFDQFLEEEKVQTETLIPQIGQRCDIRIDNNGTFEDLQNEVKKIQSQNLNIF